MLEPATSFDESDVWTNHADIPFFVDACPVRRIFSLAPLIDDG